MRSGFSSEQLHDDTNDDQEDDEGYDEADDQGEVGRRNFRSRGFFWRRFSSVKNNGM